MREILVVIMWIFGLFGLLLGSQFLIGLTFASDLVWFLKSSIVITILAGLAAGVIFISTLALDRI